MLKRAAIWESFNVLIFAEARKYDPQTSFCDTLYVIYE